MRIATVAACMSITCSAHAAVQCQTGKGGDGHWSWREIDGRRCWYRGAPSKPKAQLYWQVAAKPTSAPEPPAPAPAPEPQARRSSPVLYLQVTPATPAPTVDLLRARPMTEGALIETPGAVIRDVPAEADRCCRPLPDDLPFAERWSGLQR
jgi:hypothetical protein